MKDFSFRDGDRILENLLSSDYKEDKYVFTKHFIEQAIKRKIDINYIKLMLLYYEPLGILSSRRNRFKVFYPSQFSDNHDLILVIAIDDDEKIVGITTYEDVKSHREGLE